MSRPALCRNVSFVPGVTYFKPAGIPLRFLKEVILTIDEMEALRLKDIEGLEQEQCAMKMNISRATFQRSLYSARKNVADALINGKAIRIEGGPIAYTPENKNNENKQKEGVNTMKIAVVTDDGQTICQHFGRARFYTVVTIENGKVVNKEQRAKAGHHAAGMQHESHATAGEKHGFDAHAQASHAGMMANITDCQLVIAGGMGWGAHESLKRAGISVHMTDVENIDQAIALYIDGKLPNLEEKLH